jgi:hypothetical protein
LPPPPDTPRDLAASVADRSVTLTWRAPSGDAPVGYRVYRDGSLIAQTTNTTSTIEDLINGVAYEFKVSSYSAYGESARTPGITVTPSAPTTTRPPATAAPTTIAPTLPPTVPPTVPATVPPTTVPRIVEPPGGRYTVSPTSGSVSGGSVLSIAGPGVGASVGIEIDGAYARVLSAANDWIVATTAPHLTSGTYDIILHRLNGDIVLTRAFAYTGGAASPAPPTTSPVTTPPVTSPPVTRPPVTSPPVTSPPVTSPPATSPPVTSPPATSPPAPAPPRLGNLRLAPMPPTGPLAGLPAGMWGGMTCRQPRCSG